MRTVRLGLALVWIVVAPAAIVATPSVGDQNPPPKPRTFHQSQVDADVRIAAEYGRAHADEFGSVAYSDDGFVASFTGHLPEHESALRMLVPHPDRLSVRRADFTQQARDEAMQWIIRREAEAYQSTSMGIGLDGRNVLANLRSDAEQFAAEIHQRYGRLVKISLGGRSYPAYTTPAPCRAPSPRGMPDAGLRLRVLPATWSDRSGFGKIELRNVGFGRVTYMSGSGFTAVIVDPKRPGIAVAEPQLFGRTLEGVTIDLPPGGRMRLGYLTGRAACGPTPGYDLPAGMYALRVVVELGDWVAWTDPIPIAVP